MQTLTSNTTPWQLRPELCRDVVWRASNTVNAVLCLAFVDGKRWKVVLNSVDSPALYALYVDDRHALDFDDWPGFWRWPS